MAKTPTDIRSLARGHTETALTTLAKIMTAEDAPHAARVSAANSLLDRGWGKPTQTIAGDEESPIRVAISRIELVALTPNDNRSDSTTA